MKKVLVIVVTYNGKPWLDRCLGSVVGTHEADVFVWDNDSTDGSAEEMAAKFPQVKLIRSAENLGFSIPNNKGMEYALKKGYEYVYLLNQDAWLEPGAMEKLIAAAEAHPEYGVLSPMQYQDGYKTLDHEFSKILRCAQSVFCHPEAEGRRICDVPRVMAAHWLIPTRVIERIGPFEEELFPFYGQDDEWCRALHFCGLKIGVVKEARGVHDRASRKEPKEKVIHRNYYTGSLVRLCDVNRPLFINFLYIILFTLVKAVKYSSWLPFKYFVTLCRQLPKVRERRSLVRTRAHNAK